MPDRTATAMTTSQREELLDLYGDRALDRASAVTGFRRSGISQRNANVLGILREKGFAEVFNRSKAGRTLTHYCLTPAGLAEVERITGTPHKGRANVA
jgi:hypothetical protein